MACCLFRRIKKCRRAIILGDYEKPVFFAVACVTTKLRIFFGNDALKLINEIFPVQTSRGSGPTIFFRPRMPINVYRIYFIRELVRIVPIIVHFNEPVHGWNIYCHQIRNSNGESAPVLSIEPAVSEFVTSK